MQIISGTIIHYKAYTFTILEKFYFSGQVFGDKFFKEIFIHELSNIYF